MVRQRGFSLIELIVAFFILSMLIVVAMLWVGFIVKVTRLAAD